MEWEQKQKCPLIKGSGCVGSQKFSGLKSKLQLQGSMRRVYVSVIYETVPNESRSFRKQVCGERSSESKQVAGVMHSCVITAKYISVQNIC